MSTAPPPFGRSWQPRRLVVFAGSMMIAGYLAVFIADGAKGGWGILRDAIANTLAAGLSSLPVWWLCARITWGRAERWWFLPVHVTGAAGFAALWYATIAMALGAGCWLSGRGWTPTFLSGRALHWQVLTSAVLYFAIAAGCYLTQAVRDAELARDLQYRSEMSALRAQLDPHLLFNTLHSLLELVRSGDERADDAIDRFARVARYVTDGRAAGRDVAPLADEWRMTQDYAALESLRLGPRLHCEFDFGADLDAVLMPALSLQPLVENAIRHGIAPRPGAGAVRISAYVVNRRVHLLVEDNGLGVDATTRGTGTGLDLVRRRLAAQFGDALSFIAGPRDDAQGWRVLASFPAVHAPR